MRELKQVGVHLWEDDGTLRYRAPAGTMTPDRASGLRAVKAQVLSVLRRQEQHRVVADPANRYAPFPLTGMQQAYLLGRSTAFAFGGVPCHGYAELDVAVLDTDRLERVWNRLIRRHDMLRAIIDADGTQRILPDPGAYRLTVVDATDDRDGSREHQLRDRWAHKTYEIGRWPMCDLGVTHRPGGDRLHFSVDFLIIDFLSTQLLLDQLLSGYENPSELSAEPSSLSFRDFVTAAVERTPTEADHRYWTARMDNLPPGPDLPFVATAPSTATFSRRQMRLDAATWAAVTAAAQQAQVTPSTAVIAAVADVVAFWSAEPAFTLGLTRQNRPSEPAALNELIGDFTDLQLLAITGEGVTFADRARELQARIWRDVQHAGISGLDVIRQLAGSGRPTVFPVVITSSVGAVPPDGLPARGLADVSYGITQTPQVALDFQAMESSQGLVVNLDSRDGVLSEDVLDATTAALAALLHRLAHPGGWSATDPVGLPADQDQRRRQYLATSGRAPEGLLQDGFLRNVASRPDAAALVQHEQRHTYRQVHDRACRLADRLAADDLRPGALVAVVLPPGPDQVIAVLGVLLAGGAYLPIDAAQPAARTAQIISDAGATHLISDRDLPGAPLEVVLVPGPDLSPTSPRRRTEPRTVPADLAYVIYTSGSTGAPKGVMISHAAAMNTIGDINARLRLVATDRILALSKLSFDLSVWDIFGTLAAGGTLVYPDRHREQDPSHWARVAADHSVTIWNSVPAQAQMLADFCTTGQEELPPLLRTVMLSGDWIPVELPDQLRGLAARPGSLQVIGLGGATEAAIWSIHHPIATVDSRWASIPYGTPLTNQTVHVLDHRRQPRPENVPGELYIGGAGVADGYRNAEQLTVDRFLTGTDGERLYRTGDIGVFRTDLGAPLTIELLGRNDRQVKIRGHRIEPAEVERAIEAHPQVKRAVVLAEGEPPRPRRLVAFLEPRTGASPPGLEAIADSAAAQGAGVTDPIEEREYQRYRTALDDACRVSMAAVVDHSHWLGRYDLLRRRWRQHLRDNPPPSTEPAAAWRRAAGAAADVGEADLVASLHDWADRLAGIVTGAVEPTQLAFPLDGDGIGHHLRFTGLPQRWLRAATAGAAAHAVALRAGQRLRILEVSGGSGSTAAAVLDVLSDVGVDYVHTDPSAGRCAEAAARFRNRVRCQVLDPTQPWSDQGITPGTFDVVLGVDTWHAADSLEKVLGEAVQALAPQGWLMVGEFTREEPPLLVSLALLADEKLLRRGLVIDEHTWQQQLGALGPTMRVHPRGPLSDSSASLFLSCVHADRHPLDAEQVLAAVGDRLPAAMVPDHAQIADPLPLTHNHKIDRRALLDQISRTTDVPSATPDRPPTPVELDVADLWTQTLHRDTSSARSVPLDRGFLQLGGDSLLAARLAGRIRKEIPAASTAPFDTLLRLLLDDATVADIADYFVLPQPTAAAGSAETSDMRLRQLHSARSLADGAITTILIPDSLDELPPVLDDLVGTLSRAGSVWRATHPAPSIDRSAETWSTDIAAGPFQRVRVVGAAAGAVLALETARWLAELRSVEELVLILDGRTVTDSVAAVEEHFELIPYLGRLVLISEPGDHLPDWQALGLAETEVRTLMTWPDPPP